MKHLSEALPHAEIVATDLSPGMLEVAQSLSAAANVAFSIADMQQLPFADESFDAIVCQFGIMFPPNKPHAAKEIHRVLKKGGHAVLTIWGSVQHNDFARLQRAAFVETVGFDVFALPYCLTDPRELQRLLLDAGLAVVATALVAGTGYVASVDDLVATIAAFVDANPETAAARAARPAAFDAAQATLAASLQAQLGGTSGELRHDAWTVTVTRID